MEAIIFVGIQGAGKTTYYQQHFFHTHVRISLDMLKTRHRERLLLAACLAGQQPFVIDNTNPLIAERAVYIEAARSAGFRTVCCYFPVEARIALGRNAKRTDKKPIPVPGVLGTRKKMQPPAPEEGFDEIRVIEIETSSPR